MGNWSFFYVGVLIALVLFYLVVVDVDAISEQTCYARASCMSWEYYNWSGGLLDAGRYCYEESWCG